MKIDSEPHVRRRRSTTVTRARCLQTYHNRKTCQHVPIKSMNANLKSAY